MYIVQAHNIRRLFWSSIMKREKFFFVILDKMLARSVPRFERFSANGADIGWVVDVLRLDVLDHVTLVLAVVAARAAGPEPPVPLDQAHYVSLPRYNLCNNPMVVICL